MAVPRGHGGADAGADVQGVVFNLIGTGDLLDDRGGKPLNIVRIGNVADDHGELITAQATAYLILAADRTQALRDLRKQEITYLMAEGVIHPLEAIEIDHEKGAACIP